MDGGSLDLCLKKAIRIPEPILAKICSSVSDTVTFACAVKYSLI